MTGVVKTQAGSSEEEDRASDEEGRGSNEENRRSEKEDRGREEEDDNQHTRIEQHGECNEHIDGNCGK